MSQQRTILNVSNRLPVTLKNDDIQRSSGGLVTAMQGLSQRDFKLTWVGWPGSAGDDPNEQQSIQQTLQEQFNYGAVFLTPDEHRGFYEGFSNASLWPLLHYLPSYYRYEPEWWEIYRTVNQRFADRVVDMADDRDLVWVHDYQLMLVPEMIKRKRPSLRVGFFLHTPFPAYELYRCHPRREELVLGLLGADQVGFHTFGYLRHFRTAVQRLVGIESHVMALRQSSGHVTYMGVYPIGIDTARFVAETKKPAFTEQLNKIDTTFGRKRLVLSVERLDYTKGILRRLEAIDRLLSEMSGDERDLIKFIFISVPSRGGVEEYRDLRAEVEALVGRINGRHATLNNSPIHFIHGTVSFTELCALYAAADVGLVTPLIDGMNLVAKEYVACQPNDRPGTLVLSEFAGAAHELYGALMVNPYDVQQTADAIREGLAMDGDEKRRRLRPMKERITAFDAPAWARAFVDDLVARPMGDVSSLPSMPERVGHAARQLRDAIAARKKIALFIDYDGTLREFVDRPSDAVPSSELRQLLEKLAVHRPGLDVAIISGRKPEDLQAWLSEYPFALIADHGASLRRRGESKWERLDRNAGYAWKAEVLKVLRLYEETTPGSRVEDKRTSLVFHYRQADPEFGTWKARHLATELAVLLANEPVEVRQGRMIVEVAAAQINKGAAVRHFLEDADYHLVFCAGDDTTDESMFVLDVKNFITMKIGDGNTLAELRVDGPAAFRGFLNNVLD